jgi:hypothetical protein
VATDRQPLLLQQEIIVTNESRVVSKELKIIKLVPPGEDGLEVIWLEGAQYHASVT